MVTVRDSEGDVEALMVPDRDPPSPPPPSPLRKGGGATWDGLSCGAGGSLIFYSCSPAPHPRYSSIPEPPSPEETPSPPSPPVAGPRLKKRMLRPGPTSLMKRFMTRSAHAKMGRSLCL